MTSPATRRAVSRGERVLPGLWRLRLPLRRPGIPHCNGRPGGPERRVLANDTRRT